MSGNGAYEGEMNHVALFESALRAAVITRPDPAIGTALVPRLAETARAATLEAEAHGARRAPTAPRSRFALVARVGIAVALIPLVLAGLAFAGVTVPAPARSAFESVGITLPNQPAEHAGGASERPRQDQSSRTARRPTRPRAPPRPRRARASPARPTGTPCSSTARRRARRWVTRRARRSGSTARPLRGRPSRRRRAPLLTATPGETRRRTPRRTPVRSTRRPPPRATTATATRTGTPSSRQVG